MARRGGLGTLLLAGAAAFAYYKYSKMSPDQKNKLMGDLKNTGKKVYDQVPGNIKNMFGKAQQTTGANGQAMDI
ncbi:MAG TPA: hypothetical protein VHK69_11300 [Chitinophagaceae bacterium]|jgi:hypothetical protein|nr:hypothetical protein [Chitinophagaceae bacterium]